MKPDWLTEEQGEAVPSVQWSGDRRQGAEYIKQSKPQTTEETKAMFEKLRNSTNWKQEE